MAIKDNKLNKAMMQVTLKDEEWFCGRDVCEILEFKNSNQALPDRVQSRFEMTEHGTVGLYPPPYLTMRERLYTFKDPACIN